MTGNNTISFPAACRLAANPNLDIVEYYTIARILITYFKNDSWEERYKAIKAFVLLLKNDKTPSELLYEVTLKWLNTNMEFAPALINNPSLPRKALEYILSQDTERTRALVAKSPYTPSDILEDMLKKVDDSDVAKLYLLANNKNTPVELTLDFYRLRLQEPSYMSDIEKADLEERIDLRLVSWNVEKSSFEGMPLSFKMKLLETLS